ncbi:MAG: TolC family protein [Fimbriimonadales bacterium]
MRHFLLILSATLGLHAAALSSQELSQGEAVAEALRVSPSVAGARQHVVEAQAKVAELAGLKRFQINFQGTLSESTGKVAEPPSIQNFGTVEASLIATLPNLGRADAQVEQAREQLAAVQAQLRAAELDVEFRANQAFIEVWRAREAQTIAEENLAQATRQADDTQKRIDAGDVPGADLLKAQVPVAQDRAALARAKIAVMVATQNLNNLLQHDLGTPAGLTAAENQSAATFTVEEATAFALQHSPDVLEADANVRAARANVRFVRHARDLDFSLQLNHARTSDITAYSYLSTLSLAITFPISDGGAAVQQLKQAQAQLAQTETALKQARQGAMLSVQQGMLDVQGDEANAEATAATEQIANQSLEKARQAYAAGLTTTRDVLDAQLVYSQARIEANSARYDLSIARAHLKQLMGGALH